MQYDKYEARVAKIASVMKFIFRHMKKIILVFSCLVIITGALLGTKGIIVSAESCPEKITYGDKLSYSANAFLSKVKYEYREKDSDVWSEEVPSVVGEYYVRAAAKALFGYRYGDEELFIIEPKTVTVGVAGEGLIYGESPTLIADTAYSDKLFCEDFIYNPNMTEIEAKADSITAMSASGEDVTSSYKFVTEKGNLSFSQRPITVTVPDQSKTYDGTALVSYEYTLSSGSIADGDELTVSFDNSIINVGTVINTPSYRIENSAGEDVTAFYLISTVEGRLTVTKRELSLSTESAEFVYDGKAHNNDKYSIIDGTSLAEGDSIVTNNFSALLTAGTIDNSTVVTVLNSNGEDVTSNYSIKNSWGKLTVKPRPIIFATGSGEQTYDGITYLSNNSFELKGNYGLVEGHSLSVSAWTSVIEAAVKKNKATVTIKNASGKDVTSNYHFEYEWGTLTVNKRTLPVSTNNFSFVYDGKEHSNSEITYENLSETDVLIINSATKVVDAGVYDNIVSFDIFNTALNKTVTESYEIKATYGKINGAKRPITVTTPSYTWTYDGTEHYDDRVVIGGSGLAEGDRYEAVEKTFVKNYTEGTDNIVKITVLCGNHDVSANYAITYNEEYGILKVDKKLINVKTATDSKMYDGTPLSNSTVEVPDIVVGHKFIVSSSSSITYFGSTFNEVDEYDILDENNKTVKNNYNVNYIKGELSISKRPIIVITASDSKIYDSTPLTAKRWEIVEEENRSYALVGEQSISAPDPIGTITNYGKVPNGYDGTVDDIKIRLGQQDFTINYEIIEIRRGELSIEKRPIKITTNGIGGANGLIYDGKDHYDSSLALKSEEGFYDLCAGHNFVVYNYIRFRNVVANADNKVDFYICDGSCGGTCSGNLYSSCNVNRNYSITAEYGKVNIKPRPIKIATNGIGGADGLIYDGKDHSDDAIHIKSAEGFYPLCTGHELELYRAPLFRDVVTNADNKVEFYICDGSCGGTCDGNINSSCNVKRNYSITAEYGKVNIKPRPIKIATNGIGGADGLIYDGKDHSDSTLNLQSGAGLYPLCDGHRFVVYNYPIFRDVVTNADNKVEFYICDGSCGGTCGGNINSSCNVKRNYSITAEYGKVNIKPRPIKVTTNNIELVYDGFDHSDSTLNLHYQSGTGFYPLCDGHDFAIYDYSIFRDVVTNADNKVEFYICDGSCGGTCGGNINSSCNVKRNYSITAEYGKVNIKPRPIKVTTNKIELVYDGFDHYDIRLNLQSGTGLYPLCDGHRFVVYNYPIFRDVVANADNKVEFYICDGSCGGTCNGNINSSCNVSENYRIDISYGKVNITKKYIKFHTVDYSAVYDGKDHTDYTPRIDEGGLCQNHEFKITSHVTIKNVTNGTVDNAISFMIVDISDRSRDLQHNYEIDYTAGKINVSRRNIKITSLSAEKTYDGTPLTLHEWELCPDSEYSIVTGHRLEMTFTGSQTKVGESYNTYENVKIFSGTEDVTSNYNITTEYGTLKVTGISIKITSLSAEKFYDGTPLTFHRWQMDSDSKQALLPGHGVKLEFTGSQTEVGFSNNTYKVKVLYGQEDVTALYSITAEYGVLEVKQKSDGIDLGLDDFSGGGGGSGGSEGSEGGGANKTFFYITSEKEGIIYLKRQSYGSYNGKGFEGARAEYPYLYEGYSASHILPLILSARGEQGYNVNVDAVGGIYGLPYYTNSQIQKSDVYTSGDISVPYDFLCYLENYYSGISCESINGLREFEAAYRNFVYQNYCDIDAETLSFMNAIIAREGFSVQNPDIVNAVASYIQNAAKYNLRYNRELDNESNIVTAFLDKERYGEGVCQHYAAAATMLFRALGMPARYTVGFAKHVEANTKTEVTSMEAHAWVEVYLNGIGWVMVEVTGGGPSGTGGNGNGLDGVPKELTVKPQYVFKTYDGEPLYAVNKLDETYPGIKELLDLGYTYEVEVSGVLHEVGKGTSTITSIKIFAPNGADVTNYFTIKKETGVLEIRYGTVKIYLEEKTFIYNGLDRTYNIDEWFIVSKDSGVVLNISAINIKLKDVGELSSTVINEDIENYITYTITKNGVECTEQYRLMIVDWRDGISSYVPIKVQPLAITVETGSATKQYDGQELKNGTFSVTRGNLVEIIEGNTLIEKHSIQLKVIGSITEIGEAPNTIKRDSFKIIDLSGTDVTHNYDVDFILGTLTVE